MGKKKHKEKKNGRPVGAKKYRKKIIFKKKKVGRKWAQGKNRPLSKNGEQKKKKRWGRPPEF